MDLPALDAMLCRDGRWWLWESADCFLVVEKELLSLLPKAQLTLCVDLILTGKWGPRRGNTVLWTGERRGLGFVPLNESPTIETINSSQLRR